MTLQEVRQAAVRLFSDRGFAGTGIRDLAREVGLNSATLYHYAGGKEELLVVVMRECLVELLRAAGAAVDASSDPRVQLAGVVHAHVGLSALNPRTAKVTDQELRALSPANHAELVALRDEYEHVVAGVVDAGADAGHFDVQDRELTRLALLEMCNGVAHWYRPGGRLGVAEVQDRFVGLACRLLGADAVAARTLADAPVPVRLPSEPEAHHPVQEAV